MSIAAFRKVRPLVRKTQTKVVILERHGLPFLLWKYRRRKLFAAGAFFCIVLLYVMSLFIWNIHIEGNESLSTQVVLSYLQEEGITHGMLKRQIHGEELEKKLAAATAAQASKALDVPVGRRLHLFGGRHVSHSPAFSTKMLLRAPSVSSPFSLTNTASKCPAAMTLASSRS
jgi:hypothetical protein